MLFRSAEGSDKLLRDLRKQERRRAVKKRNKKATGADKVSRVANKANAAMQHAMLLALLMLSGHAVAWTQDTSIDGVNTSGVNTNIDRRSLSHDELTYTPSPGQTYHRGQLIVDCGHGSRSCPSTIKSLTNPNAILGHWSTNMAGGLDGCIELALSSEVCCDVDGNCGINKAAFVSWISLGDGAQGYCRCNSGSVSPCMDD